MGKIKGMSEPLQKEDGWEYTFTEEGLREFVKRYYEYYCELPKFK